MALLAGSAASLGGCSHRREPPASVDINPVTFTCYADGCESRAGKTARMGLLPGYEQPCDDVFRSTDTDSFSRAFLASTTSTDLEQRSDAISKQFTEGWVDAEGSPTTSIEPIEITACILIEGMGTAATNAHLEAGEVHCQGDIGFSGDGRDVAGNGNDGISDCFVSP